MIWERRIILLLEGIYNSEKATVHRKEANRSDRSKENLQKKCWYSQKALRRLFCLKKGIIKEALPDRETVTLKTFEHDNGTAHTQFPTFLDKDTWSTNSPDLNLLYVCIWEEFAQVIN